MLDAVLDPTALTEIEALRALVLTQREQIATHRQIIVERDHALIERDRTIVYKQARIEALTLELSRYRRAMFTARSEKLDPTQRALFDETVAEDVAAIGAELDALRDPSDWRLKPRWILRN